MTILPSNIRLLESRRMSDTSDGGGRRTSRVIPDGVAGNIFPKVGRVDSVYGRVNLRKIYPHINTATLDVYAGAFHHHRCARQRPHWRACLQHWQRLRPAPLRGPHRKLCDCRAGEPHDALRAPAQRLSGRPDLSAQEEPLPEVGEVYALTTEVQGVTTAQQFVRAQRCGA